MKIIEFCITVLLLILIGVPSQAQTKNVDVQTEANVIGTRVLISSEFYKEQRELQVYLPKSYRESDKKYPILYILDGQRYFFNGVSAAQTLVDQFDMMPEIIVVGITTNSPERRSNLTGTTFLDFLENEVLSYIDATYRTSDERLIFGWQHAGSLIVQALINRPQLFDAHIISDPFPLGGEGENTRVKQLEKKLTPQFKAIYILVLAAEAAWLLMVPMNWRQC
ncbi:MAG: hypothetical protein HN572_02285 [Kordiimonadaceae bacterium]|jgi:predicted alpha/beta superfamily hydrolase|nr:hypothetical protein [Kordiimonadaceae bacterium]MBT7581760.1 hypothetical protein [Kordiimonadaceae bacterium]